MQLYDLRSCSHGNTQKLKKAACISLTRNFKRENDIVSIYICYLNHIVCRTTDDGDSLHKLAKRMKSATDRRSWFIQNFVKQRTLIPCLTMPSPYNS
jgi:hypothetical protein